MTDHVGFCMFVLTCARVRVRGNKKKRHNPTCDMAREPSRPDAGITKGELQ